jgi:hypothetical protein
MLECPFSVIIARVNSANIGTGRSLIAAKNGVVENTAAAAMSNNCRFCVAL